MRVLVPSFASYLALHKVINISCLTLLIFKARRITVTYLIFCEDNMICKVFRIVNAIYSVLKKTLSWYNYKTRGSRVITNSDAKNSGSAALEDEGSYIRSRAELPCPQHGEIGDYFFQWQNT